MCHIIEEKTRVFCIVYKAINILMWSSLGEIQFNILLTNMIFFFIHIVLSYQSSYHGVIFLLPKTNIHFSLNYAQAFNKIGMSCTV